MMANSVGFANPLCCAMAAFIGGKYKIQSHASQRNTGLWSLRLQIIKPTLFLLLLINSNIVTIKFLSSYYVFDVSDTVVFIDFHKPTFSNSSTNTVCLRRLFI